MSTDDLIAAFGGREAVEAITGARRNAINNWRTTGIPFRHWPPLIRAASERGIEGVTFESLGSTRPSAIPPEAA